MGLGLLPAHRRARRPVSAPVPLRADALPYGAEPAAPAGSRHRGINCMLLARQVANDDPSHAVHERSSPAARRQAYARSNRRQAHCLLHSLTAQSHEKGRTDLLHWLSALPTARQFARHAAAATASGQRLGWYHPCRRALTPIRTHTLHPLGVPDRVAVPSRSAGTCKGLRRASSRGATVSAAPPARAQLKSSRERRCRQ